MKTLRSVFLIGFSFLLITTGKKELAVNSFANPVAFCGISADYKVDTLPPISLKDGLGKWQHKVSTKSADAQKYFNQGLNFIYAFNHGEAIRSFQQASKIDPECAMAYWGIAYAYGPNINMPMDERSEQLAFNSIQKAKELITKVSKKDAAYIAALSLRYDDRKREDHTALDNAYIKAMESLSIDYPDDVDAYTLYADALMNTFPWQYWEKDGSFKPKALEVLRVLENVLNRVPEHAGANHLLIHLVEGSKDPSKGLKSAAYLEYLMPKAGHIVHMPSHIYIRTGNFDKAAQTNLKAIVVDEEAYGNILPKSTYAMYYGHNIHFLYFTANMLGQRKLSMETAMKLLSKVPEEELEENPFFQELSITPYYAMIRFGMWEDMMKQQKPKDRFPYIQSIWHFGRGLAELRQGRISNARTEWRLLDSLSRLASLKTMYTSLDPVSNTVAVANALLEGELNMAEGNNSSGLASLREAVKLEEDLIYNEPPTWPLPVRQFLGAALLRTKDYSEAERIYREDLQRHPENGWSLYGLSAALKAQSKNKEAEVISQKFDAVWSMADTRITSSRF